MKSYLKTITWKFKDTSEQYPQLKGKNIKITSPSDLYANFNFLFDGEVRERFVVFWLGTNNVVTGWEVISEGSLNSAVVHPREVYRGAIVATCANIIIAHNHPSGNLEPSTEDINLTRKLVEAGKILEIQLFDHLIFGQAAFMSFVERRLI